MTNSTLVKSTDTNPVDFDEPALKGGGKLEGECSDPFSILNFELTNSCPFRCVMCARTNNMTRAEGMMDFDLFTRAIDEYLLVSPIQARTDVLWMHGFGESLVHPEFDRFIAYASERGLRPSLSINPLLLKPTIARRLLSAHPSLLYVCMDGHDNASFEAIRGVANAYDKSKEQLLDFLALKDTLSPTTEIQLSMIDFPMNAESIRLTQDEWRRTPGVDQFLAKGFTTWDGNAPDVAALVPMPPLKSSGPVTCDFPWKRLTITWDGDVTPCCLDFDKRYILGNIHHSSLSDIWNGQAIRALRMEFLSGKVTNPLCRNCSHLR